MHTRILGAGKVSGRTPGGWSVGVMNAVTAREDAQFIDEGGERGTAVVEPLANYFAGRVRSDFGGDATTAGAIRSTLAMAPVVPRRRPSLRPRSPRRTRGGGRTNKRRG